MFEEEVELETKSKALSFKNPFLYILVLILVVIAGIAYAIFRSEKPLSADEANVILSSSLKARGPSYIHFRVGNLQPSIDDKTRDPHYKLLERLGYVKLAPGKEGLVVTLTPLGQSAFTELPEFKKTPKKDGTEIFDVPLATRQIVGIKKVEMTGPSDAVVEYEWKWVPNKVGEGFDASGAAVQKFSNWDRLNLINHYGVDFYTQTKTETIKMLRTHKGWQITG